MAQQDVINRYTITVPSQDSTGKNRKDVWKRVAEELTNLFGGCTVSPEHVGYWKTPEGEIVHEPVRLLSVVVNDGPFGIRAGMSITSIAEEVKRDLDTRCIFVVSEPANIFVYHGLDTEQG